MHSSKRSHNARAVVTGAGSGFGREFALELARRGGQIVVADINIGTARETAAEVEALGGRALPVAVDVSSEASVRELGDAAQQWFGLPTLVINNAGVGAGGTIIGDGQLDTWRRAADVNLWSVVYGAEVFTPMLRQVGHGGMINTASAAGFAAAPGMAPYNMSKAGVISVSESLSAELHKTDIAVTVLCPTFVLTNIFGGDLMDEAAIAEGKRLAAKNKMSPKEIAVMTLNANDRGKLYVLPQFDARLYWHVKRFFPVLYSKLVARVAKLPAARNASPGQQQLPVDLEHPDRKAVPCTSQR